MVAASVERAKRSVMTCFRLRSSSRLRLEYMCRRSGVVLFLAGGRVNWRERFTVRRSDFFEAGRGVFFGSGGGWRGKCRVSSEQ